MLMTFININNFCEVMLDVLRNVKKWILLLPFTSIGGGLLDQISVIF